MNNQDDFVEIGTGEIWDQEQPVQGIYVQQQSDVGPNNSKMYTLRTKEGDISIWGSTVLDGKFAQLKIGQEVRVEYTGLSANKGKYGKPFKTYKVLAKPLSNVVQDAKLDDQGEIDLSDIAY